MLAKHVPAFESSPVCLVFQSFYISSLYQPAPLFSLPPPPSFHHVSALSVYYSLPCGSVPFSCKSVLCCLLFFFFIWCMHFVQPAMLFVIAICRPAREQNAAVYFSHFLFHSFTRPPPPPPVFCAGSACGFANRCTMTALDEGRRIGPARHVCLLHPPVLGIPLLSFLTPFFFLIYLSQTLQAVAAG